MGAAQELRRHRAPLYRWLAGEAGLAFVDIRMVTAFLARSAHGIPAVGKA